MAVTWVSTLTGVDIAVHQLGGHGRLLLFAPANGFHGRCYQPLVRRPSALPYDRFVCVETSEAI